MEEFLFQTLGSLPHWLIYVFLCLSSFLENVFPPFPGDTIIVFGAYLAGIGILKPLPVLLWTALGNLASNILIYYVGRRRGRDFIRRHPHLFPERMLSRAAVFYRRWGIGALFFSRFLVGLRSIVPLFAGISRFKPWRFLAPVMISILVQHSLLVWLGDSLGRNWAYIKTVLRDVNLILGLAALAVFVLIWRWYSRQKRGKRRQDVSRTDNEEQRIENGKQ